MPNEIDFIPDNNTTSKTGSTTSKNLGQRIFQWTIGPGKKIIIIIELVIVGMFLARFKLDQNLVKLKKDIELSSFILLNQQEDRDTFKNLQYKINKIKEATNNKFDWELKMNQLQEKIPSSMKISTLMVDKTNTTFSATVKDAASFGVFIHELINDPAIKKITLSSSSYNVEENEYEFRMNIVTQNENEQK